MDAVARPTIDGWLAGPTVVVVVVDVAARRARLLINLVRLGFILAFTLHTHAYISYRKTHVCVGVRA